MNEQPQHIEIECPGCRARFKLKPKNGKLPSKPVKCPKCETQIPVEAAKNVTEKPEAGTEPVSHAALFGRPETRLAPPVQNEEPKRKFTNITAFADDSDAGSDDEVDAEDPFQRETSENKVVAPTAVSKRDFAPSHTKIDMDPLRPLESLSEAANEGATQIDTLSEAEQLLDSLSAESESAEPEPQQEPQEPSKKPVLSQAKLDKLRKRLPRAPENKVVPPKSDGDVLVRDQTAEIPKSIVNEMVEETSSPEIVFELPPITAEDLEVGFKVKVENVVYGPVPVEGFARLLKGGVWTGVIQVQAGEFWVPMHQHPIFAMVEDELQREAHGAVQSVLAGVFPEATEAGKAAPAEIPPPPIPTPVTEAEPPKKSFLPAATTVEKALPPELLEESSVGAETVPDPPTVAPAPPTVPVPVPVPIPVPDPPAPETQPEPIVVAPPPAPKRKRWPALLFMVLILAAGPAAYLVNEYVNQPPPAPEKPKSSPEGIAAAQEIAARSTFVAGAFGQLRRKSAEELQASVADALERANYGDALETTAELRRRQPENIAFVRLRHKALMGTRSYDDARTELIDATVDIGFADEIQDLFVQTIQNDETLQDSIATIGDDEKVDSIRRLGGGRSISFKMKRDGENVFAFKPAQAEWENRWRAEVAAWRLCEIAACEFRIPRSRTARVSKSDFDALYPMTEGKQTTYAERFVDLRWETVDGNEYLFGVLKDWVPHFTDYPIEYTSVWEPWLNATAETNPLDTPFKDAIRGLYVYKDGEYYRKILREQGGASTRQVARQISNIMVFDFLTNNWDRFSTNEEYYGVNNQFADGHFVSIDNGACFHEKESARVDARFESVERASRRFIASLRLLDPEWLNPILYPNPTEIEQQRLEVFWNRRDQVLERFDELTRRYGEEKVYVFR